MSVDEVSCRRHRRRDALHLMASIGALGMATGARAEQFLDIDMAKIPLGSGLKANWRGQPIFIRHLTPAEVSNVRAISQKDLRDPQSLEERTKPGFQDWLIVLGICPHLGCTPLGGSDGEPRGAFGGFLCPCHGSQFDAAGRVMAGPSPSNLEVPDYRIVDGRMVRLGAGG